jgi:hypothetical protein
MRFAIILSLVIWTIRWAEAAAPIDFDKQVAPILIHRCLDCHLGEDAKGGLDLSTLKGSLAGGDTAAAVVPNKPEQSLLWRKIKNDRMPPKKPLPEAEKQILKAWLEQGAKWGTDPIDPFAITTEHRAGRDWWALQPVKRPSIPKGEGIDAESPIDALIRAKLKEKKLTPSPPADPRTLVRRLYFDLVGLPPPVEVVDRFVKDPSERAYRQLVDDLLASPQYGERWARYWLDIVRYGESDGFERNNPRPNAYHYRDFVIKALNRDMPYNQFAKYQIAGDALQPTDLEAIQATGFLVAGIHNTVLGTNAIANKIARHDELEDMISTVGQTFLGLTVACARCHDHKFDPITQRDYYRMVANLDGVTHGERTWVKQIDPRLNEYREELACLTAELNQLVLKVRDRIASEIRTKSEPPILVVNPLLRWSFNENAKTPTYSKSLVLKGNAKIEKGKLILDGKGSYAISPPLKNTIKEKTLEAWVKLGNLEQRGGGIITIEMGNGATFDSIVFAERQPKKWLAGSNSFKRTQPVDGPDESADPNEWIHLAIVYDSQNQITLYRNGKIYGLGYRLDAANLLPSYKAGESRLLLGLRHTGAGNGYFHGEIDEARLYDRALTPEEVALSAKLGPDANSLKPIDIEKAYSAEESKLRNEFQQEIEKLTAKIASAQKTEKVFAVVGTKIPKTHVLSRGDVTKPREEVFPAGIQALQREYQLRPNSTDEERRKAFAEWIADAKNPLFTRTIVNRLWHYHFGIGIVETPSDFGFNGGRPSHPELLDWLAAELVEAQFSLKHIHRLIVTSQTYRQSSERRADCVAVDADNRLLWRKSPTRIDAETLRDSILFVSGKLDLSRIGGPSFHDVRTYHNSGTTYYEPLDKLPPDAYRRTIYRFSPRGERSALLDTFDCPDPSAQTPRRQITTTPLQALALWNNTFILDSANHLAERIQKMQGEPKEVSQQVKLAYRLTLSREPLDKEQRLAEELVKKHGLAALARVLFNCNEFIIIE